MGNSDLIHNAISDAYKRVARATVIHTFDGTPVVTRYYRNKNGNIWCRETCGNIVNESRVYCVTTKPYVRWMSKKWYLTEEGLVAMRSLLEDEDEDC